MHTVRTDINTRLHKEAYMKHTYSKLRAHVVHSLTSGLITVYIANIHEASSTCASRALHLCFLVLTPGNINEAHVKHT